MFMKSLRLNPVKFIPTGLCLVFALLAGRAQAALTYLDPQGTTGADPYLGNMTGTWESSSWSTSSNGVASPGAWVEGTAAYFGVNTGNGTPAYTVTMNANHTIAGVFDGDLAPDSSTVTINGTGHWLLSGSQGFSVHDSSDGSLANVIIDVPIADGTNAGQVVTEGTSGQLYLNGANTYSGGTSLGFSSVSWAATLNFDNSSSFGSGTVTLVRGSSDSYGTLAAEGSSAITIPNKVNFSSSLSNAPYLNIVGNAAGVTFGGDWTLGSKSVNLGSGGTGNVVNISGVISGSGSLTKLNSSTLLLSAVNTYSGSTTVSAGRLQLGVSNAIASSSSVVMNGGILDPGGFHHVMTSTTLGLTASSMIDFGAGAGELDFADSSSLAWNGILNLTNWNSALDDLRFGTTAAGLTSTQLADIEFDGTGLGTAQIDSTGYIVVPEPSTTALLGLFGGLAMLWSTKRKPKQPSAVGAASL